jgi:hypothetical protein
MGLDKKLKYSTDLHGGEVIVSQGILDDMRLVVGDGTNITL